MTVAIPVLPPSAPPLLPSTRLEAVSLSSLTLRATTHESVRDATMVALDGVAGIDLDREAADLVRLQQAYGGAARILQVAREMLDTLLNATR